MEDEIAEEGSGDAFDVDGVPVAFVHVVAGLDGVELVAKVEGAVGVALEIEARRDVGEGGEGEEFVGDFEDEDVWAERGGFGGVGECEAEVADV
jgi:hypothetical protein